jgi:hypothetical protein
VYVQADCLYWVELDLQHGGSNLYIGTNGVIKNAADVALLPPKPVAQRGKKSAAQRAAEAVWVKAMQAGKVKLPHVLACIVPHVLTSDGRPCTVREWVETWHTCQYVVFQVSSEGYKQPVQPQRVVTSGTDLASVQSSVDLYVNITEWQAAAEGAELEPKDVVNGKVLSARAVKNIVDKCATHSCACSCGAQTS